MLAAIIYCEAAIEPIEGQYAVGSVVMNRVANEEFPDTIAGVLYQSRQFSPVGSGRFALALENGYYLECIDVARDVLNGTITVDFLYFRDATGWSRDYGTFIGTQVFY